MAKTYQQILDDYQKYNKRTTAFHSGSEAILAAGEYFGARNIAKQLTHESTKAVRLPRVDLKTYDTRPGATRSLNQAFRSMIAQARESGRRVDPMLLSRYGQESQAIEEQYAKNFIETANKESLANVEIGAKEVLTNAEIEARDKAIETELRGKKATILTEGRNRAFSRMANIGNLFSKSVAAGLQAEFELKPYIDAESALAAKRRAALEEQEAASVAELNAELDLDLKTKIADLDTGLGGDYEFTTDDRRFDIEEEKSLPDDYPLRPGATDRGVDKWINPSIRTDYTQMGTNPIEFMEPSFDQVLPKRVGDAALRGTMPADSIPSISPRRIEPSPFAPTSDYYPGPPPPRNTGARLDPNFSYPGVSELPRPVHDTAPGRYNAMPQWLGHVMDKRLNPYAQRRDYYGDEYQETPFLPDPPPAGAEYFPARTYTRAKRMMDSVAAYNIGSPFSLYNSSIYK